MDVYLDDGKGMESHDKYHEISNFKLQYILPVYIPLFLVGMLGHVIVLMTVAQNRTLWKLCYYLVSNLAIADMGFAFMTLFQIVQYSGISLGKA